MLLDEKTKTEIIILTIGVIIGGSLYLANSLILNYATDTKEKSDIAEGLYLDVSSVEEYLIAVDRQFVENPGDRYIFVQGTPLYPDNGLYFAFQREISRMDRNIALDTFAFYNHLLSAERDRSQIYEIQRLGDLRELTKAELRQQQILTQHAAREVNASVRLLPALKKKLNAAT